VTKGQRRLSRRWLFCDLALFSPCIFAKVPDFSQNSNFSCLFSSFHAMLMV